MPIPGAFTVTFSGPQGGEAAFVDELRGSGLAAEPCAAMYPDEADVAWVHVLAHEGDDGGPSQEFQQDVMARADRIAESFGFSHRAHGVVIG
jgi:hypothetical protein